MKNTILITACFIVGGILGFGLGYSQGGHDIKASYAPKIEAISRLFPPPANKNTISGKVMQINGNTLVIEDMTTAQNPFSEASLKTRTVTVASDTKITKIAQKSIAEIQAAMIAAQNKPGSMPPSPYAQVNIQLSDIQVGDTVTATASGDILQSSSFTAIQIQLSK
jgi:hypothetical protein